MHDSDGWLVTVTSLSLLLVVMSQPVEAQEPTRDAAYWQAYIAVAKPNSTVKLRLNDGTSFDGRLVATSADEVVIRMDRYLLWNRWFLQSRDERRVPYETVKEVSKTHPTRIAIIKGTAWLAGIGVGAYLMAPKF